MSDFTGKVSVVTGGSRGIGFAAAMRLAAGGSDVAIVSTTLEGATAAAAKIAEGTGRKVVGFACDVSNAEASSQLIGDIIAEFGKIDILVNNAGITRDGLLMRMPEEDWDRVIAVNLKGAYNLSKAVVRPMMKNRFGRIICTTSIVGEIGNPGQTNYAAAKAGLIGFTKSLAKEIASRGITVNAVAPGMVETDMTEKLPAEAKDYMLKNIPLGRAGRPEEVAAAIAFLASDDAAYITGHVLNVDGGLAM